MVKYKLIYFNSRGRAETTRMMFYIAGIDFEDYRIPRDEWPKIKPSCPFAQIPILEIDGYQLCQSRAIMKYVARETDLAGSGTLDQAKVDMVVNALEDFIDPIVQPEFRPEMPKEEKEKFWKSQAKEQIPFFMDRFEKLLKSNNGGDGYFVGDGMTYADIDYANGIYWLEVLKIDVDWSKYPKLNALRQRVKGHPKIREWLNIRPQTEY